MTAPAIDLVATTVTALLCAGCGQQSETTRMRFVISRGEDGKRAGRSIAYCDDCAEIINGGGHDAHDLVSERVNFPRAEHDDYGPGYMPMYRADCRTLMKSWIVQQFATLVEHPPTERLALICAHELATGEIRRAVNTHESRLIGECVRDLLTIRFIERDMDAPKLREVL